VDLSQPIPEAVPVFGKGKKLELRPGRVVQPFIGIVYNVSKQMINHSPAGLARLVSNHNWNQESAIRIGAEALTGSLPLLFLVPYAEKGNITGAVPTDPGEKERFYETGKQPYSVKIGDRWVDYRLMGPLAMPFAEASAWVQGSKTASDDQTKSKAMQLRQTSAALCLKVHSWLVLTLQ
jgi:hypothetical protein